MPKIIGLSGYAQSGKDTVAGFLAELGYERIAFADALRDALYALNPIVRYGHPQDGDGIAYVHVQDAVDHMGWDKAKVEYMQIRSLLQRLGTEVGRNLLGDNVWVDIAMRKVKPEGKYVFTDMRFPNELEAIRNYRGSTWRIMRPEVSPVNPHTSETAIDGALFDQYVHNDSTLEALREQVLALG